MFIILPLYEVWPFGFIGDDSGGNVNLGDAVALLASVAKLKANILSSLSPPRPEVPFKVDECIIEEGTVETLLLLLLLLALLLVLLMLLLIDAAAEVLMPLALTLLWFWLPFVVVDGLVDVAVILDSKEFVLVREGVPKLLELDGIFICGNCGVKTFLLNLEPGSSKVGSTIFDKSIILDNNGEEILLMVV